MKETVNEFFAQFKEKKQLIFFVLLYSFLLGVSQTILYSIPISQFLELYSSKQLPIVYMSLGAMMFLFGFFFDYIQKKCSPFLSIILPMILFSFLQFLYWQTLQSSNRYFTFSSFVGSLLIVFFSLSISLILYYRLFTTNELKKLSGLFFGMTSIGCILAGLMIPYLLMVMSSYDIMLLSGCTTGLSCVLLFFIRNKNPKKFSETSQKTISSHIGSIKKSKDTKKYVYTVFAVTVITFFIFYLIDFIFNSEVQRNYTDQTERTIFYGYFNAILAGLSLVFSFIIYPWLYLKFGQKGAFLSFPFVIGVLGVTAFLLNALSLNVLLIFYCVVVLELMLESLIDTTVLSSTFQFFQPLKIAIREWAQFKNEMMVMPVSICSVGLFLYLFEQNFGFTPFTLFLLLVIFCTALVGIYFFVLEKKYIELLVISISKNIYKVSSFTKIGKDEIKLLEKKLISEVPSEVTYSLSMLEKNDPQGFDLRLKKVMQHNNPSVKLFCLKKVFDKHVVSLKKDVESILLKSTNPLILSRALLSYGSVSEGFDGLEKCLEHMVSEDSDVVASKLSAYLLYGTTEVKEKSIKTLHNFVFSSNENDRLIASKVLQHFPHKEYLLKLIYDPSISIRKNACTKCLIVDDEIMQALFDNISIPELKTELTNTFISHPDLTLEEAKARFFNQKLPLQKSIITIISLLKTAEAQNFLKNLIPVANRAILKRLLSTLKATGQDYLDIDFEFLLDRETKNVLSLIEMINCFGNPSTEVIFSLLAREIEMGKRICYLILSFLYPEISFSTIDTMLLKKNEDFESNLEEVLIIQAGLKSHQLLKETLLFAPEKGSGTLEEVKKRLLEVLNYGSNAFIPSLRSASIYTLGLLRFKECQTIIEEQEEDLDFLIPEFKPIALNLIRNS